MNERPLPSREDAARLAARHLEDVREAAGVAPRFVKPEAGPAEPGVFTLRYPVVDPRVDAFVEDCVREHWVFPFDWAKFAPRARQLVERADGIESATLDELRRLLTVIVRQERFGPGVIAEMAERGVFVRILERMARLGAEPPCP